ncbi:hypothetical protein BHE74_00006579, partial [Ensete ventricosum]
SQATFSNARVSCPLDTSSQKHKKALRKALHLHLPGGANTKRYDPRARKAGLQYSSLSRAQGHLCMQVFFSTLHCSQNPKFCSRSSGRSILPDTGCIL